MLVNVFTMAQLGNLHCARPEPVAIAIMVVK